MTENADKSDEYRRLAADSFDRAITSPNQADKTRLLVMAELELAERTGGIASALGRYARPAE
jgi:hypothetical protein